VPPVGNRRHHERGDLTRDGRNRILVDIQDGDVRSPSRQAEGDPPPEPAPRAGDNGARSVKRPGSAHPDIDFTASTTRCAVGSTYSSSGGLKGTGVFRAPTRRIGASSMSKPFSATSAAISAPNPPRRLAWWAMTSRFVR